MKKYGKLIPTRFLAFWSRKVEVQVSQNGQLKRKTLNFQVLSALFILFKKIFFNILVENKKFNTAVNVSEPAVVPDP